MSKTTKVFDILGCGCSYVGIWDRSDPGAATNCIKLYKCWDSWDEQNRRHSHRKLMQKHTCILNALAHVMDDMRSPA